MLFFAGLPWPETCIPVGENATFASLARQLSGTVEHSNPVQCSVPMAVIKFLGRFRMTTANRRTSL